jgi:hypothetical protein
MGSCSCVVVFLLMKNHIIIHLIPNLKPVYICSKRLITQVYKLTHNNSLLLFLILYKKYIYIYSKNYNSFITRANMYKCSNGALFFYLFLFHFLTTYIYLSYHQIIKKFWKKNSFFFLSLHLSPSSLKFYYYLLFLLSEKSL